MKSRAFAKVYVAVAVSIGVMSSTAVAQPTSSGKAIPQSAVPKLVIGRFRGQFYQRGDFAYTVCFPQSRRGQLIEYRMSPTWTVVSKPISEADRLNGATQIETYSLVSLAKRTKNLVVSGLPWSTWFDSSTQYPPFITDYGIDHGRLSINLGLGVAQDDHTCVPPTSELIRNGPIDVDSLAN